MYLNSAHSYNVSGFACEVRFVDFEHHDNLSYPVNESEDQI